VAAERERQATAALRTQIEDLRSQLDTARADARADHQALQTQHAAQLRQLTEAADARGGAQFRPRCRPRRSRDLPGSARRHHSIAAGVPRNFFIPAWATPTKAVTRQGLGGLAAAFHGARPSRDVNALI